MALGATAAETEAPVKIGQHPYQLKREIRTTIEAGYLLYLPKEYGKDKMKRWPLMLFLHGAGERGDDLGLVKKHGPPKLVGRGREMPFIVASPQCPRRSWWTGELDMLEALLDEVCEKYAVDEDRIYLTGLSMGGFGTWALACDQPWRFAAISPICGRGNPKKAARIKHLPVWVFHGAKDKTVPLKASQEMVEALKAAGAEPKFTVYPDAGHDSWTKTYDNEELYKWFLSHKRSRQSK